MSHAFISLYQNRMQPVLRADAFTSVYQNRMQPVLRADAFISLYQNRMQPVLRADALTSWMPQLKCNISAFLLIIKLLYFGVFNAAFRESFFSLNALFIHQLPDKHFQVEYPI